MDPHSSSPNLESLVARLREGNARFAAATPLSPHRDSERIKEVATRQAPFAVVLACSDSRIPVEIVFDQGFGDLFVVRLAGQVFSEASLGSIEFGVESLGARLVLVLGHTRCGAVTATLEQIDKPIGDAERHALGHRIALVDAIRPAVIRAARLPGDWLANAIRQHVADGVDELLVRSALLRDRARRGQLLVKGAVYDLDSGLVRLLDDEGN
jgi:carbonic anhydrase